MSDGARHPASDRAGRPALAGRCVAQGPPRPDRPHVNVRCGAGNSATVILDRVGRPADHGPMSDTGEKDIMTTIRGLIDEEHTLRSDPEGLDDEERRRMQEVEVALDQCWDLLRRRRARAEYGQDPDDTRSRPASEVEGYRQ
ncbi:hypothetical protein GCM10007147_25810 [Nocardiopsis kunsanensis]|uniref:DUF2630 family protein n=2 Tax=Nocardiopsis kunsanensis TaxID=141693 RepID=A0A919CHV8_9ACTN|nr:hypothetical protein GCM10007147_25810 [Nocardiopsis kunsanensis]